MRRVKDGTVRMFQPYYGFKVVMVLLAIYLLYLCVWFRPSEPTEVEKGICHSVTEDSEIYDCDYNGDDNGWHRK